MDQLMRSSIWHQWASSAFNNTQLNCQNAIPRWPQNELIRLDSADEPQGDLLTRPAAPNDNKRRRRADERRSNRSQLCDLFASRIELGFTWEWRFSFHQPHPIQTPAPFPPQRRLLFKLGSYNKLLASHSHPFTIYNSPALPVLISSGITRILVAENWFSLPLCCVSICAQFGSATGAFLRFQSLIWALEWLNKWPLSSRFRRNFFRLRANYQIILLNRSQCDVNHFLSQIRVGGSLRLNDSASTTTCCCLRNSRRKPISSLFALWRHSSG